MTKRQAMTGLAIGVLLFGGALFAHAADPLSGMWVGDWGPSASDRNPVTVELKWDGKALSGTVNPGEKGVPLEKASFDPKANTLHFEAHAKNRRGEVLEYKVEGKLEKDTISGTWDHGTRKGDFKITKK